LAKPKDNQSQVRKRKDEGVKEKESIPEREKIKEEQVEHRG